MIYWLGGLSVLYGLVSFVRRRIRLGRAITYPDPKSLIILPYSTLPLEKRIVELEGAVNFRDIGGYRTDDGRMVRKGRVYRAGALSRLTANDLHKLQKLGIKAVCDLRTLEEQLAEPDNLTPEFDYYHLPIRADNQRFAQFRALFLNRRRLQTMLPDAYKRVLIDQNADVFGRTLRLIADEANLPAVVHCTAGKDRTGITTALLLEVLGVGDDIICADYSISNRYYRAYLDIAEIALKPVARLGVTADDLTPLLSADPEVMRQTLNYIRAKYGTVTLYLLNRAGLKPQHIQQLRDLLLE